MFSVETVVRLCMFQLQPVQSMQISAAMNGYSQTLSTAGLGKQHAHTSVARVAQTETVVVTSGNWREVS
jgi:hypothetical protein